MKCTRTIWPHSAVGGIFSLEGGRTRSFGAKAGRRMIRSRSSQQALLAFTKNETRALVTTQAQTNWLGCPPFRPPSRNKASFGTTSLANLSNDDELRIFSILELKQSATKSLRQYQRKLLEEPSPVSPVQRAEDILRHLLKIDTSQLTDVEADDLSDVKTSLIDTWTTYQSSVIRDVKEGIQEKNSEDVKLLQRLQYKRLLMVRSAAESMTSILESMENPSSHHYVAILKAWANTCKTARIMGKVKSAEMVGIPQRAQLILSQMGGSSDGKPSNDKMVSVEAYNEVIKAWAYSSEYLRGSMAEQVFGKIKYPTGESLRMIIRAHAWSTETRSAFQATGHFMRMMRLLEAGRDDMEPKSIKDYHVLCSAWTEAGDRNSASKVYSLLQLMNHAYRKGYTDVCPDLQCYRDALITMSRRQNVDDVGDLADITLKEMREQLIFPDTECYRSAILAWKHVAMSRDSLHPEHAIRRTRELLLEMTEAYHRTTEVLIQPVTEDYNHVLHAMSLSKRQQSLEYAQHIFRILKEETPFNGGPDAQSYRYMLGVLRNTHSPAKFALASQLLQEVKENYANNESWRNSKLSKESVMDALTAFIRVCGSPATYPGQNKKNLRQERTRVMTMALQTLKDAKKLGLTPNSDTYTALIEACDHLLPIHGQERENVLEKIFRLACEEGFVNQFLLESFKSAASTNAFAKLVVSQSILMEDIKVVPEFWTRNVQGYKEGKKVMPLSIHGNFTFTKAAAEYRMRKLRRRTNQKLLRGGRIK